MCYCHRNFFDDDNLTKDDFDCDDYMECEECPYWNDYDEDD